MTYYDQRLNARIKLLPSFERIRDRIIRFSHQLNDWESLKKEALHQLAMYEIRGIEDIDEYGNGIDINTDDCGFVAAWVEGQHFPQWILRSPEPKPEWLQKQLVFEALKND